MKKINLTIVLLLIFTTHGYSQPSLQLLTPTPYIQLCGGQLYDITWTSSGIDSIKIEITYDAWAGNYETLVESYPADLGAYIWKIPLLSNGATCKIKLIAKNNASLSATSENFSIYGVNCLFFYPAGNEIMYANQTKQIKFSGSFREYFKLQFSGDGGTTWQLLDSLDSSNWGKMFDDSPYFYPWSFIYDWTVPQINSDNCLIRVSIADFNFLTKSFKIENSLTIQKMIDTTEADDTLWLDKTTYDECIRINKPISIIGLTTNKPKILGDTLKTTVIIESDNVVLKNLDIQAKTKTTFTPYCSAGEVPTDALEIRNSNNVKLDGIIVTGGTDIATFVVSGGRALKIINSSNIILNDSYFKGGDCNDNNNYVCGFDGGDAINISSSDKITITNSESYGGRGRDGYSHSWSMGPGGFGGDALSLLNSSNIEVRNSNFAGGEAGKALNMYDLSLRAKGGDGLMSNNSAAFLYNSNLRGGDARRWPNQYLDSITLNTMGGNGITGINHSQVFIDSCILIGGISSPDAMGMPFYFDSSSTLTITDIDRDVLPITFLLNQNYPNPFNPNTKIKFSIPQQTFVTLKVYDLLGREVTTLVNEEKQTGNYQIEFDGSALPSGVYFYQLKANEFVETKKMILLR